MESASGRRSITTKSFGYPLPKNPRSDFMFIIKEKGSGMCELAVLIRFISGILIGLIGFNLRMVFAPTRRGFLCGDPSIRKQYYESTISHAAVWLVSIFCLIFAISFGEFVLNTNGEAKPRWKLAMGERNFLQWMRFTSLWALGFGVNLFLMNTVKLSVGSLRPHFIAVCGPIAPNGALLANCTNGGPYQYVEDYECAKVQNENDKQIVDARLSFYSGHSSTAFYFMTFLILYIHLRIARRLPRSLLSMFIVLYTLLTAVAGCVAISRIYDNKHHHVDVVVGSLVGIGIAVAILFLHKEMFARDDQQQKALPSPKNTTSEEREPHNSDV